MSFKPTIKETPFELVTSIRAGRANNNRSGEDTILITCIDEPGMLELYCKKVTEEYEYEEETYQFCDYQLRWKPIADESTTQPITVTITHEYEFIRYPEVKDAVVFLLRKKEAWKDSFPYFFWCQETDETTYNRFITSFDLCLTTLQKEKNEKDELKKASPLDLLAFAKERNIISVLDNEDVCKRLYPFVPEMFRTPAGLKRIIRSSACKKNVAVFQNCMSVLSVRDTLAAYGIDNSSLPDDPILGDVGAKAYVKRIEDLAKKELEDEK